MRTALSLAAYLLLLAYPAAVYFGLTHLGARSLAAALLPLLVLNALVRVPKQRRSALPHAAAVPLLATLPLLATAVWDDHHYLLATPVLINLVLLVGFAGSLRAERPIVEHFARLQVDDLSAEEIAYCRSVTVVWSVFFALNAAVTAALALAAPIAWWALHTGVIAYVAIGALASVEYVVRKQRFGRFGDSPVDRALRAVLRERRVPG